MPSDQAQPVKKPGEGGCAVRIRRCLRDWRLPLLLLLVVAIFCESAWLVFLTPNEADIVHYECYGLTFWLGSSGTQLLPQDHCAFLRDTTSQPALHMLPQEYPPLTILLFSLPLLAPLPYYSLLFALLMTLLAGLIYWLLARADACRAAPIYLLYLLLGAAGVFQERFDLLPAACVLICVLAAERGRWRTAYIALALGVLLKLYPIVLLPALFLAEQRSWLDQASEPAWPARKLVKSTNGKRRVWESALQEGEKIFHATHARVAVPRPRSAFWRWRNCLFCVALLIVVTGVFALLNFNDAIISPLNYFLSRPPQIEALIGSVIWLGGHFGAPYTLDFNFGSLNINSSLTSLVSPVDTLLTIVGFLAVLWLQWRERITLVQAVVGLLCVLIATGKVFSPQYLIWLIPLLAYVYACGQTNRLWMGAWALISLLTTFIYVFYYSRLPDPHTARQVVQTLPGFFAVVTLRNLLLAMTVLAFVCGWLGTRPEKKNKLIKTSRPDSYL